MLPSRRLSASGGAAAAGAGGLSRWPVLLGLLAASLLLNSLLLLQKARPSTQQGTASSCRGLFSPTRQQRRGSSPFVLCDDSCPRARNGVCDEGRGGNVSAFVYGSNWVYCDLGTDCTDCGPWHGVAHGPAWTETRPGGKERVGPIQYLMALGIEVRVRQTPLEPRFFFAFTDPAVDSDESAHAAVHGLIEPTLSQVAVHVMRRACDAARPGQSGLVVDVGGNFGWFSLLAASLGCRVLAYEPVPIFRAFFEYSAARSSLTALVDLRPNVVSTEPGRTYTLTVPTRGQWGATKVGVQQTPGAVASVRVQAVGASLRDALPPGAAVDLFKVDVEGFEPVVFEDAEPLIRAGLVGNILFEYAPGYYAGALNERGDTDHLPRMMLRLFDAGYQVAWLPWGVVFDLSRVMRGGWEAPLPPLRQVVRKHSEYDLWSMRALANNTLPGAYGSSSWPCAEMRAARPPIAPKPDDFGARWAHWHPKGLHAAFVFNTNLWASMTPELQPLAGLVNEESFPLGYSAQRNWFPKEPTDDAAYSDGCGQPETAVAARCACPAGSEGVCGGQQAAVLACGEKGLLGYPDFE